MRKSLLAACVLLVGCGADNSLGGSVSELFPLGISNVEVLRNDFAIQVTYYANRGTFLDVVARVVVSTSLLDGGTVDMSRPVTINLAGESSPGHQITSVAHAPGGEATRNFPNVKNGDMNLFEIGAENKPTRGNFSMAFDTKGGDLGQGRTLLGTFAVSRTKDAGFGDPPPP